VSTSFQVVPLSREQFENLIGAGSDVLRTFGACRLVADAPSGYPCRVSLTDARVGETLLLLPFAHHDVDSPYRASGPIYVRENATTARPQVGEIPEMLRKRALLSVRAYNGEGWLIGCDVVPGADLDTAIQAFLADEEVDYVHLHNARPGCYLAKIVRR